MRLPRPALLALLLAVSGCAGGGGLFKPSDRNSRGPGEPVAAPQARQEAQDALAALGRAAKERPAWRTVACGPAFWLRLAASDPQLKNVGVPAKFVLPGSGVRADRQMEGRAFSAEGDLGKLYGSLGFERLAKTFAAGRARPASAEERLLFYRMAPFEIAGKALTVFESEGKTLVLESEDGTVWLDVLSDYAESEGR